MKRYLLLVLILMCISVSSAFAEVPPPIKGEDFQRPKLLDCQTYWIEELGNIHGERKKTYCFYSASFFKDNVEQHIILVINPQNNHMEILHP